MERRERERRPQRGGAWQACGTTLAYELLFWGWGWEDLVGLSRELPFGEGGRCDRGGSSVECMRTCTYACRCEVWGASARRDERIACEFPAGVLLSSCGVGRRRLGERSPGARARRAVTHRPPSALACSFYYLLVPVHVPGPGHRDRDRTGTGAGSGAVCLRYVAQVCPHVKPSDGVDHAKECALN